MDHYPNIYILFIYTFNLDIYSIFDLISLIIDSAFLCKSGTVTISSLYLLIFIKSPDLII